MIEALELPEKEIWDALPPKLLGRVFHVTSHEVARRALAGEGILTNENGTLDSGFGSSRKSFFRLRGCVSFFDFRDPTPQGLDKATSSGALNPRGHARNCPAFLFLDPRRFEKLLPWTLWDQPDTWNENIVPWVECGHPGAVDRELITDALFVTIVPGRAPWI